jgi:type II secretory pathway predicted ATPase ExeA
MYEAFFRLNSRPFPSTPRVDRYFPASAIEDACRTLSRCVDRAEGPGVIIGSTGTGKSLLCLMLATRFRERFHVVKLDCARLCTRRALLQNILFELGLPYRGMDEGELRLSLIDFLEPGEASRDGMLLSVDEAHTLPLRLIEEIRMITNLVRDGQPRVRLILAGSPALEERLASPKLESLNQRIAARCYLQPLNYDETLDFVRSQIAAVGGDPNRLFADDAIHAVYQATGGIPRLINQVCDHALILASMAQRPRLDAGEIEEAWADLQQLPIPPASGTQQSASTDTVIEFGSLDEPSTMEVPAMADDSELIDDALSTDDTDVIEDELEQEELDAIGLDLPVQDTREIDLTHQLGAIEQRFTEIESLDAGTSRENESTAEHEREDLSRATLGEQSLDGVTTDPFTEHFECEEAVVDHYSMLDAQSQAAPASDVSGGDVTAAIEKIFGPAEQACPQQVDAESAGLDRELSRDHSPSADRWEEAERILEMALENEVPPETETPCAEPLGTVPADVGPSVTDLEAAGEKLDRPEVVRASVLRSVPPDDSDLIVIADEQIESEPLDKLPPRTHRREYRDLFTRLREN